MELTISSLTKSALFGLLRVVFLISLVRIMHLNRWGLIVLLILWTWWSMAMASIEQGRVFPFASALFASFRIAVFVLLLVWLFHGLGVFGLVLGSALVAGYIIARRWRMYMFGVRQIETVLYGKPLDKENWVNEKPPSLLGRLRWWR